MKNKILLLITTFIFFSINISTAQTAREISEKSTEAVSFEAMEMLVTLKIYDANGRVRERTISSVSKEFNGVTKTLIKLRKAGHTRKKWKS